MYCYFIFKQICRLIDISRKQKKGKYIMNGVHTQNYFDFVILERFSC